MSTNFQEIWLSCYKVKAVNLGSVFIFSQILTEYVVIEPRVSVSVSVCLSMRVCVCIISTAHTDWSILMKLSTNDLEDICQ